MQISPNLKGDVTMTTPTWGTWSVRRLILHMTQPVNKIWSL